MIVFEDEGCKCMLLLSNNEDKDIEISVVLWCFERQIILICFYSYNQLSFWDWLRWFITLEFFVLI